MRKLGLTLLLAAVTAAPVSAGSGGWSWTWTNACGGNSFITCMSGSISYSGTGNALTVFVRNVTPYSGDVFTAVGLFNMPAGLTPGITANDLANWSINNYNGINGALDDPSYAISSENGINNGFGEDGIDHQFTFTFANFTQQQMLALQTVVGVGVHAQRGPNGCSAKVGVINPNGDRTGEALNNFDPTDAAKCVSVPEPESYALLATGLLGLGFVALRRRKEEEDAA